MDFEEEQTKEVYAHYGLTMYLAQVLEHGIVNALVILRLPDREKYTRHDIDEFMEGKFQKTLGALIRYLKAETTIPTGLEDLLSQALSRRNYLAHDYFRERAQQFVNHHGRSHMLTELQQDQQLFERADDELSKVMKPIRTAHGVTEAVYDAEYKRMCETLGILP